MHAQLVPIRGGGPIAIVKDMTLVGRQEECDLRLDHKSVSKLHCMIVKTDGLLLVRDLGSTNGTRVNGQRIRRAALLPNDQLTIAGFPFLVQFGGGEEMAVSPTEKTQQISASDMLEVAGPPSSVQPPSSLEMPIVPNPLPDIYSEGEKGPDSDVH
jgi:pSer/pThr/pTyr-binding forkhead associated (FHA) protein